MPDITMCSGDGCPLKENCYRYLAEADPYRQSYFAEAPIKNGECGQHWPTHPDKVKHLNKVHNSM
jgi:hypothetical protein